MQLDAAILPPAQVLEPLVALIGSIGEPATGEETPARFLRRRTGPEAVASRVGELDLLRASQMSLPLAGFGNVTSADAGRIAAALRTAAGRSPGARVQLAGGTALEFPTDRNLWARIVGEVDALGATARGVMQSVEQLGFFVDRRKYRPLLCVGTVNDTTTAAHLEEVVAVLEAFEGEPWTTGHASLLRTSYDGAVARFDEMDRFPLAPP